MLAIDYGLPRREYYAAERRTGTTSPRTTTYTYWPDDDMVTYNRNQLKDVTYPDGRWERNYLYGAKGVVRKQGESSAYGGAMAPASSWPVHRRRPTS